MRSLRDRNGENAGQIRGINDSFQLFLMITKYEWGGSLDGTTGKKRINAHTGDGNFGDDVCDFRNFAFAAGISHVPDGSGRAGGKRCDHRNLYHCRIFRRFSHGKKGRCEKISVGTAHGSTLVWRAASGGGGLTPGAEWRAGAPAVNDGAVPAVCNGGRDDQLRICFHFRRVSDHPLSGWSWLYEMPAAMYSAQNASSGSGLEK